MTNNVVPLDPTQPLTRLVGQTITVADLVSRPIWSVPHGLTVVDAATAMTAQEFDVAGLEPSPSEGTGPTHYVVRDELQRAVDEGKSQALLNDCPALLHPITATDCVERSLPVFDLLALLRERDRLFVLQGNRVGWIVVHADLGAPAFSVAVLAYLTLLESGLKQLSVRRLNDDQIRAAMTKSQLQKAEMAENNLRAKDVQTEFRDCLYLDAWLRVTQETELLKLLGYSKAAFKDIVGSFPDVRNDLAHGRGLFAQPVDVQRTLDRTQRIIDLTHHVWTTVRSHGEIWNVFAATEIVNARNSETLAGSDAIEMWPFDGEVFVITAWNPGGQMHLQAFNENANRALEQVLNDKQLSHEQVEGRSIQGDWVEQSYLVRGLSHTEAAKIAATFAQTAFFGLSATDMRVYDTYSGGVMRQKPRVSCDA